MEKGQKRQRLIERNTEKEIQREEPGYSGSKRRGPGKNQRSKEKGRHSKSKGEKE